MADAREVPSSDPELARVRVLARVLDSYFLDPIIGLVLPGAGDVIGALLGLYPVAIAIKRKMSAMVIARMLLNLALDAVLGVVPLIGDLFDVGWKANKRNAELLLDRAGAGGRASSRDWLAVVGAVLAFVAVIGLLIYGVVALIRAIA